jgi:hypothetical protein
MKLRKDSMQEIVASKASVFVSTARRIDNERHHLKKDKLKGVPQEVGTDSLSAAHKNKEEQRRLQTLPACKSVNYSQEYVRVMRAINIKRVYLVSAQIQQPQEANQAYKLQGMLNKLQGMLNKLEKYEALIVDDIGYVKKTGQETSVLFELIAHRYERHRLIITSNHSLEDWDALFTDVTMTVAAIDRLVHHAHIVQL